MKALIIFVYFFVIILAPFSSYSQAIIINHENAFLEPIPAWAIKKASDSLHIAYGHTSHGSQITYGMKALANQTTDLLGYKGDFYCWKEYHEVYGDNPCLDIDDGFKPGDLGHNGDTTWAASTRDYLLHEERAKDINVVMWSWCGGCSDNTDEGIQKYLNAMSNLEQDFPDITFIYMTGHLDHWSDATLKHNNQLIRDYCIANNKVLYDFADIESYDPDNNYFEFANDNCDYYNADGSKLGNWAEEWQNSHVLGHDWYQCSAAHSKPLNGNRKAYAAWWMWARLIGWQPDINIVEITQQPLNDSVCDSGTAMFSIDFNSSDSIRWQVQTVDTLPFIDIFENDIYSGTTEKSLTVYTPDNSFSGYKFRCKVYLDDTFAISNPAYLQVVNTIPAIVKYYTEIICYDLTFFGGKNPSPGSCKWNVLEGDAVIGFPYQNETDITNLSHGKNTFEYITSYLGCNDTLQFDVYRYDSLNIINQDTLLNPITGDDLSFSINIAGDLEFAQWYKGDNILNNGTKYSSVNSPNLLIKNVENSDKGYYWCDLRGYCNEMFSDSVFVDITNATSNSERESNIIIYPNPVNNRLNIKSNQDIMSIEVYGINGYKINEINNSVKRIDVSNLDTGIYFMKIITANNIFFTKIVKM